MNHVDYPHEPGTLYDCEACEQECFCSYTLTCIACAMVNEQHYRYGA